MTDQTSVKVRMVRCPKCTKLLVELPDFTLYKCGGCGTSLQAKNWKPETLENKTPDTASESPKDTVSSETETRTSIDNLSDDPPKMELFLDKENENSEDDHDDSSVELHLDSSVSTSHFSSPEIELPPNEHSIKELKEESKNKPLGRSENYDYKIDDEDLDSPRHEDKDAPYYVLSGHDEKSLDSLTNENLDVDGDLVTNRHVGLGSQSAGRNREVDDSVDGLQMSLPRTTYESGGEANFASPCNSPIRESHVSLYITSPDVENVDHSPVAQKFRRFSSSDTLGDSPSYNLGSGLNVNGHGDFTNYPTSGSYHTYYGSESSYDGIDDQNLQHALRPSRKNKQLEKHVVGGLARLDKEQGVSKLPLTSSDPELLHGSRSPSSFGHRSLPPRPITRPSQEPSCSEPDKMDLLRTVYELKDQLKRMQIPKTSVFPPRVVEEKYNTPFDHYNLPREGELYHDRTQSSAYLYRRDHAKSWGEPCETSRLAFSGNTAHCRHHTRCTCLHCCAQEHHHSSHLPSHFMHRCKNVHCMVASPHHCTSSEHSSHGCETPSDHREHRENEMKRLISKEKHNSLKKHILPLAGGAPYVTCYYCWELLQIPAEFLIVNRRYHQLMCNSCKKVLKFSLLKGSKIVRYLPNASAPPPSEAGDYIDVKKVSPSDDHGQSFDRSCPADYSEREKRNTHTDKISPVSRYEVVQDIKMKSVLDLENKNKVSMGTVELVGSSSKVPTKLRKTTSEIEERQKLSNSPLHRLMGYSSPRQVLNN